MEIPAVPCASVVFDIQQLQLDGWTVVAIVGDLDLATAPVFRRAIASAAITAHSSDSTGGLAVDLSAVDFVDSVGIGIILGGLRRQLDRDLPFAVVAPSGPPRSLLDRLRLGQILTLVDNRGALAALQHG